MASGRVEEKKQFYYNFDEVVERQSTGSYKWDIESGELPMWVADMDFDTAPEIKEALERRLEQGAYGYGIIPDSWYSAYQNWWKNRHDFVMEKEWLIFCTGVVPAISSMVRKLTTPNENVVILTPVYNIFFNSIVNNGCRVLECPLKAKEEYDIDFPLLEQMLADPQTTLMIFCNPHNPVGKIWEKETLQKVGELCKKHHVVVISDEIHCDLTAPGYSYQPFASVSETCKEVSITCIAPTKTFNLAGLQTAAVCVPNPVLRHKVWRGLNTDEVAEPNILAVPGTVAAFTKGEPWLEELREYIQLNKKEVVSWMKQELPMIKVVEGKATYLMWLDCEAVCKETGRNSLQLVEAIRKETGLILCEGSEYGRAGENFLRLNVACPRSLLQDGLNRFRQGIKSVMK